MKSDVAEFFDGIRLAQQLINTEKISISRFFSDKGVDRYIVNFNRYSSRAEVRVTKKRVKITFYLSRVKMIDEYFEKTLSHLFNDKTFASTRMKQNKLRTREFRQEFKDINEFKVFFNKYIVDFFIK